MGDVIFSDGVFHRSQLETPFGVHRGIDATTYRLDPATGRINTEWQHTTPNPWNVTFDKWGNIFQIYGDGDVYDGSSLIWTPLGAYHPYAYARITSYGKGSGNAVISSPNFPDQYQQGMASASLLGRYAVNLTKLTFDKGLVKQVSYETILSSPNAAFRPADLEFGMDGALYVSDFCSPIIGHAQHPMRDPHWDHDYGRIWRLVHTGKPLVKAWPKIEGESLGALCELLTHPQDLVRHHVRIALRKHGQAGLNAVDAWLAGLTPKSPNYEQAVLEALFVCEGLGEVRPTLLQHLLESASPLYRGAAVHTVRLQADRLDNVAEILSDMASDAHPRVQIEVIDAVAHLRPRYPEVDACLTTLVPANKHVSDSLATLDYGIEPAKGRSVPVLEVAPEARLTHWLWLGPDGKNAPLEKVVGRGSLPGVGLFRTFVYVEHAQSAIIAINHKSLEIRVNDVVKFSQDSLWSGDQQVNVDLVPGLNVVEVFLRKGRRPSKTLPTVSLYDPVGQALSDAKYITDMNLLRDAAAAHARLVAERGNVLRVQAAAGLQFAPKKLRVVPGSKVRLVFSNPDIMMHNWILLKPGSVDEVGALADQLAASADGIDKAYLPESDKILVASKLLVPKETQELVFQAPTEPGEYPYICTFPGHWRIMQGVLTVAAPVEAPVSEPAGTSKKSTVITIGERVVFETAESSGAFKRIVPPRIPSGQIAANEKTNNDSISVLTDGKLVAGYGPIFGNGEKNGAYKMDLGKVQEIKGISSWSYNQGGRRAAQTVTLYGSQSVKDPGWNVADPSRFKRLGTISTKGQKLEAFAALSLRSTVKNPIGRYRWVVWQVSPTGKNLENTAFQELTVETGK